MTSNDTPQSPLSEERNAQFVENGAALWGQIYLAAADFGGEAELQGVGARIRDLRLLVRWAVMSLSVAPSDTAVVRGVEASLDAPRVVRITLATPTEGGAAGAQVDELGRLIVDTDASRTVTVSTANGDLEVRATETGVEWGVRRAQLIAPLAEWGADEQDEWVVTRLLDASLTPGPLGAMKGAAIMHRFASRPTVHGSIEEVISRAAEITTPVERWAAALSVSQRALAMDTCRAEATILGGMLDALLHDEEVTDAERFRLLLTASRGRALLESFVTLLEHVGAWTNHEEPLLEAIAVLDALGEEAVQHLSPLPSTDDLLLSRAATYDPLAWWVQLSSTADIGDAE